MQNRKPNRLINEQSPYLQQHAYNPVDWYAWGEEAFAKAQKEDKPIFLSIGYSTCHWCHVMERESFENDEVAEVMNKFFVNIKLDREERPDIDTVYMTALQALTGSGGWPLSAFLTPELKPFFLGTYFPPKPAYNRPSFIDLLHGINRAWVEQRDEINSSSEKITNALKYNSKTDEQNAKQTNPQQTINKSIEISEFSETELVKTELTEAQLTDIEKKCSEYFARTFDSEYAGFGSAPKFPRPSVFEFLLRCNYYLQDKKSLEMTTQTLLKMSRGGMYDRLGGGFARYSVTKDWKIPHFEKMLYDQAQLLSVMADVYAITKEQEIKSRIEETINYLERDLLDKSGAFYCAEDADSEGVEGKFYVWKFDEIMKILRPDEARIFIPFYNITASGNFENGLNILHSEKSLEEFIQEYNAKNNTEISLEAAENFVSSAQKKLFLIREKRIRPHRDEKILTAWNGLIIAGLAKCAKVFGNEKYLSLAKNSADAVLGLMIKEGRLMRRMKNGEVKITGFLDDYAFFIYGLIELYQASLQSTYLSHAEQLLNSADELFYDNSSIGYFNTSGEDKSVLVRMKPEYDSAEPSGNSVMAMNLLLLGEIFYNKDYTTKAKNIINCFVINSQKYPSALPLMLSARLDSMRSFSRIVFVKCQNEQENKNLLQQIFLNYKPNRVVVAKDEFMQSRDNTMQEMKLLNNTATIYVCENNSCQAPTNKI